MRNNTKIIEHPFLIRENCLHAVFSSCFAVYYSSYHCLRWGKEIKKRRSCSTHAKRISVIYLNKWACHGRTKDLKRGKKMFMEFLTMIFDYFRYAGQWLSLENFSIEEFGIFGRTPEFYCIVYIDLISIAYK